MTERVVIEWLLIYVYRRCLTKHGCQLKTLTHFNIQLRVKVLTANRFVILQRIVNKVRLIVS